MYCKRCNRKTNHEIITNELLISDYNEVDYQEEYNYIIAKCRGCDEICFVISYYNEDMVEYINGPDGEYILPLYNYTVYPDKDEDNIRVNYFHRIDLSKTPQAIKELYNEIFNCLSASDYLLATAGIRMLIEGISMDIYSKDSKEDKKKPNTILQKIDYLVETGNINKQQGNILQSIRVLGNTTIHDLKEPNIEDIRGCFEVVNHILTSVYEIAKYENIGKE